MIHLTSAWSHPWANITLVIPCNKVLRLNSFYREHEDRGTKWRTEGNGGKHREKNAMPPLLWKFKAFQNLVNEGQTWIWFEILVLFPSFGFIDHMLSLSLQKQLNSFSRMPYLALQNRLYPFTERLIILLLPWTDSYLPFSSHVKAKTKTDAIIMWLHNSLYLSLIALKPPLRNYNSLSNYYI